MSNSKRTGVIFALAIALVLTLGQWTSANDRTFVHRVFTDNMVLQRDTACPVWGWSVPGEKVKVTFADQTKTTVVATDGRWSVRLDAMPASSEPRLLTIQSESRKLKSELKNIVVGDVWLCSGQSNMDMGIGGVNQWWNELPGAPVEGIRLFWVQPTSSFTDRDNVIAGAWQVASRKSLQKIKSTYTSVDFSAIAWFYGRALHRESGVPIGLIECALGNTAIQAWSTEASLRKNSKFTPTMTSLNAYTKMHRDWALTSDPGWAEAKQWIAPDFDDSGWAVTEQPMDWKKTALPGFNGLGWFRRQVDLPPEWAEQALVLNLGAVRDRTAVWFNGTFIGAHDGGTHKDVITRRHIEQTFSIPADAVRQGKNLITVRVQGNKGLVSLTDSLYLARGDGGEPLSLKGTWKLQAGTPQGKLRGRRNQPDRRWVPGGLYHGMVAPLAPFAIKGAVWYQGEGNAGQKSYADQLTALIRDWRMIFEVGDFPFYIVQLSGYGKHQAKPYDSSWAFTRELQANVSKNVPNCGLAVSIDRGEVYDIHPSNKRDVGERLALIALAKHYNKKVAFQGPTYSKMTVEDGTVRIHLDHAEGLKSVGGGPAGIAIAGADKMFIWAQAKVEGDQLIVWSSKVSNPVAVRYAWGDNSMCNLYNRHDLPAVPFRTDTW